MSSNPLSIVETVLTELENAQTHLGQIQVNLLQILTDDQIDDWDRIAQRVLIKLEGIQRSIGETQVEMVRQIKIQIADLQGQEGKTEESSKISEDSPVLPPSGKCVDLEKWLTSKGFTIKGSHESQMMDEAADRLALYLGDNFASLEGFYESVKRTVSGHRNNKWFSVKELSGSSITTILNFGNKAKDASFFSEFFYVKRDKTVMFVPLEDGRVTNFFTGDWFERFVLQRLQRAYRNMTGKKWTEVQSLRGVQVLLPDGRDAEFDLLISLPGKVVVWLECKTGQFSNYIKRLRNINQRFMRLPGEQVSLVIAGEMTQANKASAINLTGFSVINPDEIHDWLRNAIGIEVST